MVAAKQFTDLLVWQKSHLFVLEVYKATSTFPKHEMFTLSSQMRRAAISIPANIAEGFKKRSPADKARLMNISQGSIEESRYYLILARDLGYVSNFESLSSQLDEVSRMLHSYVNRLISSRV